MGVQISTEHDLENVFSSMNTMNNYYAEVSSYYNFYKYLCHEKLWIYDITLTEVEEVFLEAIKRDPYLDNNKYSDTLLTLKDKKFVTVNGKD